MKFVVYSKESCPYCTKVGQVLELTGSDYEVLKLNVDFTSEEFGEKFGFGSTFPRVLLDGKLIGGCVETISYLKEKALV
jgi:glutaredoxin 3